MKILDVPRSGSYQGITSSRNRNGQYVRTRAQPVNPNSPAQAAVRGRLSANATAWRALTSAQREGWRALGLMMSRSDALGQSYNLTGLQAFCSVNNNLRLVGSATLSDAPVLSTPNACTGVAVASLTAAAATISYTNTPLPTGAKLLVFASPQRSAGRSYEGDLRLVHTSAAAAASPADVYAGYVAKFGTPVVGNKVFFSVAVSLGGFVSDSVLVSGVVSA